MTTQFDFLESFNYEAYEIAMQIEDEVISSPASVKTYATTFLECIVDDMLLKSGNKNINPLANFTPKVKKLSMFGVIKYSFETQLITAYKLRNTAHYSLKKTADEDKRLALELYEKLFHIAWRYFQEFGGNEYNYLEKPKFIPPFRENEEKELVEVPNIERMEKIYDHCIICGRKNNSHYHNLCNDCNNKIEHVEDIINLKNHFEGNFTKRNVMDVGYSKPYSDALIRELLNENLITKVDKAYSFNDGYFNEYLSEIEMYGEIELVLSEFASGKLPLKDIKNTDYYLKGKQSQKPYTQLYKIVNDAVFKRFLSQLELGVEIDDIVEDTTISIEEIHQWYFDQLNLIEQGIKTKEFISYNKILMDSYIKLKASGKKHDEIVKRLHLPDNIYGFWLETHIKEFDSFKFRLDDTIIDLVLKAISENKTKSEIFEEIRITSSDLDRLLEQYIEFSQIYQREYVQKRREKFLFYLNENNFTKSVEKSYLEHGEITGWLKEGEKDFELNHQSELSEFYEKTIQRQMKQYVKYRLDGFTKEESCEKINQNVKTINSWLKKDDSDIFINFQNECKNITLGVIISAIKKGNNLNQAAKIGDMSVNNLRQLIVSGREGDLKYAQLWNVYNETYIPHQLSDFLDKLKSSKYKKAIKRIELTENELDAYYIKGLEGDKRFSNFSDEFFQYKLNIYKKDVVNKGKDLSKAAKNAHFLDEDFKYRQDEIDEAIIQIQLKNIIPLVKNAMPLQMISDKFDIDFNTLTGWYIRGYEGDEIFHEFSECYWFYRMSDSIDEFQEMFDEGISEEFFLDKILKKIVVPEYEFYKSLNQFTYVDKGLSYPDQANVYAVMCLKEMGIIDEDEYEESDIDELIETMEDENVKKLLKRIKKESAKKN